MARNTCAAVSASPSAVCGRCAGRPSEAEISDRLQVPGSGSPRSIVSTRQSTAVSTIRRAAGSPPCEGTFAPPIGHGPQGYAHPSARRAAPEPPEPRALRRGRSPAGRGYASTHPWWQRAAGRGRDLLRHDDPAALDRDAGERDHLVTLGVEPGGLDVDRDEARVSPGPCGAPRQIRSPSFAADPR